MRLPVAVAALEPRQWTGPVESPFGLHLVLVRENAAPSRPDLAAVRPMVEREILAERKKKELNALYERMLAKYRVEIGRTAPAATRAAAGSAK